MTFWNLSGWELSKRYSVVEILSLSGHTCFQLSEFRYHKRSIDLIRSFCFKDFDALVQQLIPGGNILLLINTDAVISRFLPMDRETNDSNLVPQLFPNASDETFVYQVYSAWGGTFISLAEKKTLRYFMELFESKKLRVSNSAIGLGCLGTLTPFLEHKEIRTRGHVLKISENAIISEPLGLSEDVAVKYVVNGLQIGGESVPALGLLLNFLGLGTPSWGTLSDVNNQLLDWVNKERRWKWIWKGTLITLLIALTINFFVFNHYFSKTNELVNSSLGAQNNETLMAALRADVALKEKQVTTLLHSNNSRVSFFLDTFAQGIPESILLEALHYQPPKKPQKDNSSPEYAYNVLEVKGESTTDDELNSWILQLERMEEIEQVHLHSLTWKQGSVYAFRLKINLRNEN